MNKIKSNTMKKSWKLGLIKAKVRGIETNPLNFGQKLNHLTIIKLHHTFWKYHRTNYFYLCKCDCGKEKIIVKESIINGDTKSCGCFHAKQCGLAHRKEKYSASLKAIYNVYKEKAKRRKISFELTLKEFKKLTSQKCFYCGINPTQHVKSHKNHYYGSYIYNGLDRIDSKQGYISLNLVPCCKYCNYAKNDLSTKEFYKHIKKIYGYIKKRK